MYWKPVGIDFKFLKEFNRIITILGNRRILWAIKK